MKCPCENAPKQAKGCKGNTPPVLEIHSQECPVLFHTVNIPASVGTVETMPPTPGAYRNARVFYEADNIAYLYDSDGIPQLLSMPGEGGGSVESVNGKTGAVVLDASDVGAQPTLTAGTGITISGNTISADTQTFFYANVSESGNQRHIYKNPDMTGEVSAQELLDANENGQVVLRMSTSLTPELYNDAYLQNTYVGNADYQFLFLDNRVYYEYDATTTADTTYYYTASTIQLQMSAGTNVQITGNTISATDTTYSNFVGTDGVDAGTAGLVPAPATTDAGKFLKADGTWATAGGTLYTTYGTNEDGAMTQKATTALVYTGADPKKINIGDNSVTGGTNSIIIGSEDSGTIGQGTDQIIVGHDITTNSNDNILIGHGVSAGTNSGGYYGNSIAIGHNATASYRYTIAIGHTASATAENGIAFGHNAKSSGQHAVAIGKAEATTYGLAISPEGSNTAAKATGNASSAPISIGAASAAKLNGLAIGYGAKSEDAGVTAPSVAIGRNATTNAHECAVALGSFASPRANGVVDVSTGSSTTTGYNSSNYRVISGVYDGVELHDAATVAQGNTLATSAPTTATVGVLGQLYTDTTAMHTYQLTAIDTTDPDNPSYTWQQRW